MSARAGPELTGGLKRVDIGEAAPRAVRYLIGVRNQLLGAPRGTEVIAVSRAILNELSRLLTGLMAPQTFADWAWVNWAILSARASGRIYLLPEDMVEKIDATYDAHQLLRESLQKEKGWKSPDAMLVNPMLKFGETPPGADLSEVGKLTNPGLEKQRTDAIEKAFVAYFELMLHGLPPAARAKLAKSFSEGEEGLLHPPPTTPGPPSSPPPGPPTSASME